MDARKTRPGVVSQDNRESPWRLRPVANTGFSDGFRRIIANMTDQMMNSGTTGPEEAHSGGPHDGGALPRPPKARKIPHARTFHDDTFIDPYEWMRDKESDGVREYVEGQNAYCETRTAHLGPLRRTLFDELSSRVQQTDMSVPTRVNGYWYFTRVHEGEQYGVQCRVPIRADDDWDPVRVNEDGAPGSLPGEEIVFDANAESRGHEFFRLGGMDISHDGRRLLYGVDTSGDERYDFRVRDLPGGDEMPETIPSISGACLTPDGRWIFYTVLDDAWRPCAVRRHRVGTSVERDVEVFRENDERFWVGVGLSFDERNMVIVTGSKTTTEVWMLPTSTPEGAFDVFIPRRPGVEYDVSFSCLEHAGAHGEDVPLALIYHNAFNPNFEVDAVDMRSHKPPYALGEGTRIVSGSPYGCERGDDVEPGASDRPVDTPYTDPGNPPILRGARGLGIEGIAMHRHFVTLAYRAEGLPAIAVMTKSQAIHDFTAHIPWDFRRISPRAGGLYSISTGPNPSYDAPRMRYSLTGYTHPGQLCEIDPASGGDVLLKQARVLHDFDAGNYSERRMWVRARDGENIPVSVVWRPDRLALPEQRAADGTPHPLSDAPRAPMFITGYGAYEISSDPGFSVARLSLLDRGVLYAVAHVRGGGEMGRAWYEQGRRTNKKHTFEDFVDVTEAMQTMGYADPSRTVANGGSAGGLLMGAVANMAPERYAGIEADVPFVDALTSILDPGLPLTVTEWDEWGDPLHDEAVYRYMKSYSPYENAPSDARPVAGFPRILITTSMNDTRVLYVEPLKWLARLQSAGVDAMAKIEVEAGHGGTSGRYRQWRELCYENAWCLDAMGVHNAEPLHG